MSRHEGQLDFVNSEELKFPIHLIGCGGIGSWTALMLAKMGCSNITVYDDDTVEDHNVASQFFKENQLDSLKTKALYDNVLEQTGIELTISCNKYEKDISSGLVIFAIDSMEERIRLGKLFEDRDIFVIDGRMGGLQMEIYSRHIKNYAETLCDPLKADQDKCTGKSISFNCGTIGSWIANFVRMYAKKKLIERTIIFDFENLILVSEVPQQSQPGE